MSDCPATFEAVREQEDRGIDGCPLCGHDAFAHQPEPPYYGDEPLGTCVVHGHYWTPDCTKCRADRRGRPIGGQR